MRILTILLVSLLSVLSGCTSLKISENEDKGVKEVLALYGGLCKYSINWAVTTNSEKQKKFELEISQSEVIDKMPNERDLLASGIAYTFFKNLQKEKKEYTHIKTVLVTSDGTKRSYEFTVDELETVQQKMPVVKYITQLIKEKRFNELKPMLNDSSYIKYNKEELISNIIKAEPEFGNAIEFVPLGYSFFRIEGHNNLHIAGQIKRDKLTNNFSVDIDVDNQDNRATLINYKF